MGIKIVLEELGHLLDGNSTHEALVGSLALVNLALFDPLETLLCLFSELRVLNSHASRVARIRVLSKLFAGEGPALWRGLVPAEEEGEGGEVEELVLRLLAVLVHGLAHDGEVDQGVLQEVVILVMPVGEDKEFEELNELELCLLGHSVEESGEFLVREGYQRLHNRALPLARLPLVEEGLVGCLEVESHRAEAGPLKGKVEVEIVVSVTLFGTVCHRHSNLALFDSS